MTGNTPVRHRPLVRLKEPGIGSQRNAFPPAANDHAGQRNDKFLLSRIRDLEQQLELTQSQLDAQNQYAVRAIRDAEVRIKQHLSYRFGQEIIRCGTAPFLWARLPFRLLKTYREYLADKRRGSGSAKTTECLEHETRQPASPQVQTAASEPTRFERPQELTTGDPITEPLSRRPSENKESINPRSQVASNITTGTGKRQRLRALSILDDFSHHCFESEFELIPAEREKWRSQIAQGDIDFFFAESAWRGNGGKWSYALSKFTGKFGIELAELVDECKKNSIPTVFWNKEDPLNYEVFLAAAKCFDYVFTTDENMIARYRRDLGHERVYVLPFAANSKLHTPILAGARNGRVAFAGSWHGRKYPLRAERLRMLFEHPQTQGLLDIFDRHSGTNVSDEGLTYPAEYKSSLLPAVPYKEITDRVYKKYSVVLNVNSVETSTSMLARRVYELCGCGTPVLSSPAMSLEGKLKEVVPVARDKADAQLLIQKILDDDLYALKLAAKGVRFVHSENTYTHRAAKIAETVFGHSEVTTPSPFAVTAICVSKRPWYAASVARMLANQKGVDLSVIYVAHGNEADEEEVRAEFSRFKRFKFLRISGENTVLADGLNSALEASETDIVAKFDDDDYYGDYYLFDSCLALRYSQAALVGKASFFCYVEGTGEFGIRFPGKHYRYFKRVQGGTLVWDRNRTEGLRFTAVRQGTDSLFIKDILNSGQKVFSSDPFNFVHVRHSSANNHTWAISDQDFLRAATVLDRELRLDIAFI